MSARWVSGVNCRVGKDEQANTASNKATKTEPRPQETFDILNSGGVDIAHDRDRGAMQRFAYFLPRRGNIPPVGCCASVCQLHLLLFRPHVGTVGIEVSLVVWDPALFAIKYMDMPILCGGWWL